jgi:hypothetical protein
MKREHSSEWRAVLLGTAFLLFAAVVVTGLRNTYTEHRLVSASLSYTASLLWTGFVAMAVYCLARTVWTGPTALIGAATAFLIIILYADPYASGRMGGDTSVQPMYPWQIVAAGLTVALLLSGWVLVVAKRRKLALLVYGIDLAIFVGLNVHFILRDGLMRLYAGFEGLPGPAVFMFAGFVVRTAIVSALAARSSPSRHDALNAESRSVPLG